MANFPLHHLRTQLKLAPPSNPQRVSEWPRWVMLVIFIFIAFESALLAAAMKGAWFILFGPAIVCTHKAIETWRELIGPKNSSSRPE